MSAMLAELRHALRVFRAQPAFALAAVLTLALGIGANSAIFSLVEALLVRPLPYHDPGSLVGVTNYVRDFNAEMASGGDYLDWQEQSRLLSAVEAFDDTASLTLTGREQPERLRGARVSVGLLPMLGITPAGGRGFRPEEGRLGGPPAVILSARLADRLFGAADGAGAAGAGGKAGGGGRTALGALLQLDGSARPVVGVLPRGCVFPGNPAVDLLVPLQLDAAASAAGARCRSSPSSAASALGRPSSRRAASCSRSTGAPRRRRSPPSWPRRRGERLQGCQAEVRWRRCLRWRQVSRCRSASKRGPEAAGLAAASGAGAVGRGWRSSTARCA